jgi:hypothetical protein
VTKLPRDQLELRSVSECQNLLSHLLPRGRPYEPGSPARLGVKSVFSAFGVAGTIREHYESGVFSRLADMETKLISKNKRIIESK